MKNQIEIYTTKDKETAVEVRFEKETVWLSLNQMSELFQRDKSVISRHIGNIYKEKELQKVSTVAKFATVQEEGNRDISRNIQFYNLDVIISLGYRVKSKRGTQFRQWATKRLKDYLVQGYAINEKRLEQKQQEIRHLKDGIRILSRAVEDKIESSDFKWLKLYSEGLRLLDDYDHETLDRKGN